MQNLQSVTLNSTKSFASYAQDIFQVIAGSLFLSVAAQIAIPFIPVPLTMQTFAVMLLGLTLGPVKGALSVALYIAESMTGLPILANFKSNPTALVGLCGGYIFGWVVQAYLTGLLFEKSSKASFKTLLGALLFISALQLGMGTLWLASFIGLKEAIFAGFVPFIIGETLKCIAILKIAARK